MDTANALDARCLSALVHHRQRLEESINISSIIDQLKGVISEQEFQFLSLSSITNDQKVKYFVDILSAGSQEQFDSFIPLLRAPGSKELADSLDHYQLKADEQEWSDAIVREVLVKGQVDFFEKVTARPEKLELIRRRLRGVRSRQPHPLRVVLVHGMGGSGKSVLASEAVRCAPLMAECFSNGVIWISAGHMRGLEGTDLELAIHELLIKILARTQGPLRLDQKKLKAMTTDLLVTKIIDVVSNKDLLLVLDDVWKRDVLTTLKRIPILVLVTSRNKEIADGRCAHIENVEAMECTAQEASDIVKCHCGIVDEKAMKALLKRCNGLPLALAIWASVLKDKSPREQMEIASAPNKAIFVEDFQALPSCYECLADALEASILELERDIKKKEKLGILMMLPGADLSHLYLDIAAVDDDERLYASKLAPVWDQTIELTRELLKVLADRNLLTRTGGKYRNEEVFAIHDVQLDFLRQLERSREGGSLNGRYKRWIEGFLRKNKEFSDLVPRENSNESRYFEELWRIVQAFEKGPDMFSEWTLRCPKPLVSLEEQRDKLSQFQENLFIRLLPKPATGPLQYFLIGSAFFMSLLAAFGDSLGVRIKNGDWSLVIVIIVVAILIMLSVIFIFCKQIAHIYNTGLVNLQLYFQFQWRNNRSDLVKRVIGFCCISIALPIYLIWTS